MDTTNTPGRTSSQRSSSGYQLRTLTGAGQPGLRPAPGEEEIPGGAAYGLYPNFPSNAKSQNLYMPTPSTSESTPHVMDNTNTLDSAIPRRSHSGNRLHSLTKFCAVLSYFSSIGICRGPKSMSFEV